MTDAEAGQAMFDGGASFWSAQQWAVFRSFSQPEREAMAQIALDSPTGPGTDGFSKALAVAGTIGLIAADVAGVGSGVQAIQMLVKMF